jgi:peptide-methionine (R)-S-oxide reductase
MKRYPVSRTNEDWRKQLSPDEYRVARECGTEPAFTGKYWDCHEPGMYRCVCCGAELFGADTKFDSGTGWPSFFRPAGKGNIEEHEDLSHGMRRVEVKCAKCGAHLGHVFPDGPQPTGLRYCINSASLKLERTR